VNRISVGVQSFDPGVLSTLDRVHDAGKVREVIAAAKSLGYRVSADLIYGAPGETLESWRETLLAAIELGTEHISAYSLIVEPGTALARKINKVQLEDVDEDLNAEKYELTTELLEGAGYGYYETSNFGQPSIHNLAYWTSQNWWGYGPGAHSHVSGSRFWNHKHPQRYADALPASPAAGMEVLSLRQRLEEELLLGLRLSSGVRANLFDDLEIAQGKIDQLVAENLLEVRGERVLVTKAGRLLVDRMVVDFLS
jgi:coproporphyrinogen III oxidase-like Fe-S oxidoreductase